MADVERIVEALDRLEDRVRDDARRDSEPSEPQTTERTLADRLAAARSRWFHIDLGSPSS
jgi:hypothetical protein